MGGAGQHPAGRSDARWWFWVRRYGPAEASCLLTVLVASLVAARLTTSPPLLAASAIAGATVGFYGVLVVTVAREQRRVIGVRQPRYAAQLASRTVLLLTAEFGAAELLDTFVWRPVLMVSAVVLLDAMPLARGFGRQQDMGRARLLRDAQQG